MTCVLNWRKERKDKRLIFGDLGTMARNTSASHAKVKFNRRGTCQILRRVSCSVSITVRLLLVSDESEESAVCF